MKIVLPSRTIGINFEHEIVNIPIPAGALRKTRKMSDTIPAGMVAQRRTTCEVFVILDESDKKNVKVKPLVHSVVKAHFKDPYSRAVGRLNALKRCMTTLNRGAGFVNADRLTYKERELLWGQYFKLSPPPSKPNVKKLTRNVKRCLEKWVAQMPVDAVREIAEAAKVRL